MKKVAIKGPIKARRTKFVEFFYHCAIVELYKHLIDGIYGAINFDLSIILI